MNEDRPKATSASALEQRTYHAMMEFAPWPMAEVEGATHVLRAMNAAFCALLKKSREELLDKPMAELFEEEHSIRVMLERVLGTGEATSHIETARNTPGPVYWSYTCWPVRAADRLHVGLMIQVTETSALQQQSVDMNEALLISSVQQHELTETADKLNVRLREEIGEREIVEIASNQLASIVAFSEDAIISKNLNGIVTSWNHGAEKIFGYTSDEMMGTPLQKLIPLDRQGEEAHILGKIRLGESVEHFDTVRQTKDGRSIHVSVTVSPIKDAIGKVVGASKIARDITERKQLESALERKVEELAEVDRRKSEFLATLAHELRNPLAPLRNGLELLALSPHDQATWDQAHGMMGRQMDQMVRLIDELMDLSRISRGTVDLRLERVDLRTILEQAAEMSRPLIERQEHTMLLDIPHVPVPMQADAMRLIQVFTNLLNNAAKYTDHGGSISVRAEVGEAEVTVLVEDNGIGIAPDQLSRVFDMFAQVERANDRVQGVGHRAQHRKAPGGHARWSHQRCIRRARKRQQLQRGAAAGHRSGSKSTGDGPCYEDVGNYTASHPDRGRQRGRCEHDGHALGQIGPRGTCSAQRPASIGGG